MNFVANDDWPTFVVRVIDPGPNRAAVSALYRQSLGIGPEEAKGLLAIPSVEVARGPRMLIEDAVSTLTAAGARVRVTTESPL